MPGSRGNCTKINNKCFKGMRICNICAQHSSCPVQVPIYTLHMLTFPQPERFWPERWADPAQQQQQQQGKTGAPAKGRAGAAGMTLQVQVIA